ncbi:MAG TPA: thiamine pyrophosphate-dependent enzyme [Nocardioides sp.]|uniref:thiamine pyrophosphate-dependent enzyme n=1 Tax=uncultured Nocardioides sp. TaxID=198441 RepID=UPI000EEB7FB7|nr:thiamine pyrophosphate-dependent enzyme [uncultured Nocardioides sp.]HCB04245.1 ubiquinone-dependent pyruvate dehydrogenase [Nocardioides sp.]HRD59568.1 thiamine pyrophosphate-dependent enzyme [Nocardioides sp.]HRI95935.1 thiamine pyrophosphate-dependent enzyme [Nocardioides sp.]HRK44768.1 thiamine pyrophosphate-dependent enzyme [Nocardioides sp.]
MAQTVAEILVDQMVEAGIRKVYGIVGDSANPIVDALRRHTAEIEFVHVRNEEAGAFAAGADAQISGRPTAVLGSSGPGSLHLVNGLYDCQRNGAPVFAIATHIPSTEIGSGYFQETNPEQIFSGCTNYVALLSNPGQMPRISELALQAAILERGVGMVIVPGDVAAQTVDNPMLAHPILTDRPVIRPTEAALDRAVELISKAKKIAIHGGEGTRQARDEVLALSRTLQAPVSYAYRGKDVLEAENPNGVGMTGLLGWGGASQALADCDLLLMLGTDFPYHAFLPAGKTIIQVDDKPLHLGRRAAVDLGLVGDVGETLRALIPKLEARSDDHFLRKTVKHHHSMVEGIQTYANHEGHGQGLRPEMVATALSDLAADDAVFTVDTGMCNVWGARYLTMKPGRRILASFSHGSMANALPQALGAKSGSPDRQVVALCGDGGLSMLMGELLTAAGLGIDVKLMVFNNSTLGMVRAEMMVVGYQPWGTDVQNPDFGAVAQAIGLHGERVERAADIRPAIERAFAHPGPALIDFVTDPRALAVPPHTTVEEVRGFALTTGKLIFGGDFAEVWGQAKSNIRDVGQAL